MDRDISSRDKIALLVASGAGVAFWYLAQLEGYGGTVVTVLYAVAIIPLIISIADRRYLLVWQVCVFSMAFMTELSSISNQSWWTHGPAWMESGRSSHETVARQLMPLLILPALATADVNGDCLLHCWSPSRRSPRNISTSTGVGALTRIPTTVQVGCFMFLAAIAGFFCTKGWIESRTLRAVDMPVSLARGTVTRGKC